ncbi:3-methyl-2-oxobutanoate hydroxymethyltransferase [Piscinibacter koreensis]|jgi:3-methyl-2-oxobutanoate hydroxymethyltransferase|uniref:3-methyl-2-oxobutanoate hydroxymethyltransferase n=1 Tax=Piscinibacter koreensis TaxID=2742824 RepID=A0A7Y6NSL1_9BURK|nr:3-methyl-2-oxobutanoate hydroxymethyltransferase [Schlegelella koreensis]NUZ08580.1 3-methyl-2-oxobutanoate hydroxymethyltransferase [Schlegelella koreensis]
MSALVKATRPDRKPVSLLGLRAMLAAGEKIAMLTAYDATFARAADDAGADCLLVGDSLGMVVQGGSSTVPVTLDEVAYHVRCVARGRRHAWLLADLPFGTYEESPEQALRSSAVLARAGAQMVKLEGGWTAETVHFLVERGIVVCAHLGLTPQSASALGGYRVQGRDEAAADRLVREARALADAGAAMLVLELVPAALARRVQQENPALVVIGIGAGGDVAGQVLVLHDMLGVTAGPLPRFVRDFGREGGGVHQALQRYVAAVKDRSFPEATQHTY